MASGRERERERESFIRDNLHNGVTRHHGGRVAALGRDGGLCGLLRSPLTADRRGLYRGGAARRRCSAHGGARGATAAARRSGPAGAARPRRRCAGLRCCRQDRDVPRHIRQARVPPARDGRGLSKVGAGGGRDRARAAAHVQLRVVRRGTRAAAPCRALAARPRRRSVQLAAPLPGRADDARLAPRPALRRKTAGWTHSRSRSCGCRQTCRRRS